MEFNCKCNSNVMCWHRVEWHGMAYIPNFTVIDRGFQGNFPCYDWQLTWSSKVEPDPKAAWLIPTVWGDSSSLKAVS